MYHALYGIMDYVNEFGVIRANSCTNFKTEGFWYLSYKYDFLVAVNISSYSCFCIFYTSIASISSRNLEIRSSHHISERNELILERVAFSKQQH